MTEALKLIPAGRVAFVLEDTEWIAYYAETTTMEGAIRLGAISAFICDTHPKYLEAFSELVTSAMADILEEITGARPKTLDTRNTGGTH